MATPVTVNCPADTWTLVAQNVTAGQIKKKDNRPNLYLETYRMTGGAAPTLQTEGVKVFVDGNAATINSPLAAIDVYIMAVGSPGAVRRDV